MPLQKKFYQSVSLLLILNILIKPLWIFFIDRNIQLAVGNEVYGNYYALINFSLLFSIILDAGLSTYFTANYTGVSVEIMHPHFKKLIQLKIILSISYAIIVCAFASLFSFNIQSLFIIIITLQIFSSFLVLLRTYFTNHQQFTLDSFFSIGDKLISGIILGIILLFYPSALTITKFGFYQLVSISILLCIILFLLYRKKLFQTNHLKVDFSITKHLKKALPYAVLILLMTILLRTDVVLLKWLHSNGNAEAGKYAYGLRLLDAMNSFGFLFASFLFPFLCKNIVDKNVIKKTIQQSSYVALAISIVVIIVSFFFKKEIANLLYHQTNTEVATIIFLCCTTFLGCALVHIYSSVLTASKNLNLLIWITAILIVFNLVLNIIFIPQYGAIATAIILLVTQILYGITLVFACKYKRLL